MSYNKALKFVLLVSTFISYTAAAECAQPEVVEAQALVASTVFVGMRDQVMDPSAGRIASLLAANINSKKTDASIDRQVKYLRCIANADGRKQIIASIGDNGAILLQRNIATGSEIDVATSKL